MSNQPSENDRLMEAWLRPLSMPSIRVLPFEKPVKRVNASALVRDLCWNESGDALEAVKKRYLKLSTEDLDISVVPAEKLVLNKIVWPLKSAKHAFCLADFLGCIALSGAVCEMVAVFIYDLASALWDISKVEIKYQKVFAGRRYERMGQAERIKNLQKLGAIPNEFADDATTVREIRREYLHYLSKDYTRIEEDAYRTYTAAFRVVKSLVALPLGEQGKLAIPAHLRSYLQSKGVL